MATNTTTTTATPTDFDFNATCRFFKSSFARTLSLNNGSGNNNNNNNNMNAANNCRSLDFDLNQHFNRNNGNNNNNVNQCSNVVSTKTDNGLEVANKQTQAKRTSTKEVATNLDIDAKNEVNRSLLVDNNDSNVDVDVDGQKNKVITTTKTTTTNKQLPANLRLQVDEKPILNKFYKNSLQTHQEQQQQQQQSTEPPWQLYLQLDDIHENNATTTTTTSTLSNFNRKTLWSRNINSNNNNKQNLNAKSTDDTTDMSADVSANKNRSINCNIKTLNSQQQQQHQQQTKCTMLPDSPASKVETVLLRNQVDTLQWQLKQVETSCEMYRAVMQEVARFLERYQAQKQQRINQNSMEQISRSKSLYQVYAAYYDNKTSTLCGNEAPQSTNHLRAKSSNNLIDMNAKTAKTTAPIAPITARQPIDHNSYSAFKDFTWRRSPKKLNGHNGQLPLDEAEEKLSQEGFRLFRTIQNLLNTSIQQPDLTQHRNSLSTINLGRLTTATTANNQNNNNKNNIGKNIICDHTKLKTEATHNAAGGDLQNTLSKPKTAMSTVADMLFMRSNNMRDSRLSMRSSTDSSVHSTTSSASSSASSSSSSCVSSKVETDEEATISPTIKPSAGGSTTEDESGFSSINSFQDVGVPAFSSTLIERRPSSASCASVRPKSMPPQQSKHPNNIVGLPDAATHVWDVKPTPLHNNPGYQITRKFQRYSTISTEETGTVLWV